MGRSEITQRIVRLAALGTLIPVIPLFAQTETKILTVAEAAKLFVYQSKPVHPFCLFFPFDSARWEPMDLAKCTDEKVTPQAADGWLSADYPSDGATRLAGTFASYRVLAKKGERFLVASDISGGGSGKFTFLFWVQLDGKQLTLLKDEAGGDRCAGRLSDYSADGEAIRFAKSVTTSDIVDLADLNLDGKIKDKLRDTPADCAAEIHYRYDLASENMQLTSLELNAEDKATGADPQGCFDRLVQQYAKSGRTTLTPEELKEFGRKFAATCVAPNC